MSSLRPQFFCTRPNGSLTPLIAVDELPSHISIRGVPRVLSPSETQGMTSLGTVSPRTQLYVVEGVTPTTTRASVNNTATRSRNHDLQTYLTRLIADENIPANQRLALHSLLQQGLSQNWLINTASTGGWLVPNSGNGAGSGSSRQKEYCSYWIRHGECDYQQQGCLYKHEMPSDLGMLEKLGLRDIPRWYREKFSIPSLLPHGSGSSRSQVGNGHHWKDEGYDHGAVKSIQYLSRLGINGTADHSEVEKSINQKLANYTPSPPQQSAVLPAAPQSPYQCASSPPSVSQKNGPKGASRQHNLGAKKIDLLSFDHIPEYSPAKSGGTNLPQRPKENSTFEPVDKGQRADLMRNLQSLVPAAMPTNGDYLAFDSSLGHNRSKKMHKSRRLYQHRSQASAPDTAFGLVEPDPLNVFPNQAVASSSGHSVASKNTYSQLTSSIIDPVHGSAMSESPPRGVSPSVHSGTSLSSEFSPSVYRTRVKDKAPRRAPGVIGMRKAYRKRSVGSSEEDLFSLGIGHAKE